jgi:hypothetical protein
VIRYCQPVKTSVLQTSSERRPRAQVPRGGLHDERCVCGASTHEACHATADTQTPSAELASDRRGNFARRPSRPVVVDVVYIDRDVGNAHVGSAVLQSPADSAAGWRHDIVRLVSTAGHLRPDEVDGGQAGALREGPALAGRCRQR